MTAVLRAALLMVTALAACSPSPRQSAPPPVHTVVTTKRGLYLTPGERLDIDCGDSRFTFTSGSTSATTYVVRKLPACASWTDDRR